MDGAQALVDPIEGGRGQMSLPMIGCLIFGIFPYGMQPISVS